MQSSTYAFSIKLDNTDGIINAFYLIHHSTTALLINCCDAFLTFFATYVCF